MSDVLTQPVVHERIISVPVEKAFRALTVGEEMEKWFFSRCETNPVIDGGFNISWESEVDPERNHSRYGRYIEFINNEKIAFEWGGLKVDDENVRTIVRISLEPAEEGVKIVLTHEGWGESEEWQKARHGHLSGWQFYMDNLKRVLEGGEDRRADRFGQFVKS